MPTKFITALDRGRACARRSIRAPKKSTPRSAIIRLQKVPLILVVGKKESEGRTVALRRLGGEAQEIMPLAEAAQKLAAEALPPDRG